MNRFAALGLAAEVLVSGSRIVVLTPHRRDISDVIGCFESVPEITDQPGFRARRLNGDASVDFGGRGRIAVRSVHSTLRGLSADVVFIDEDADRSLAPSRQQSLRAEIERVTAGSDRGEVVRA